MALALRDLFDIQPMLWTPYFLNHMHMSMDYNHTDQWSARLLKRGDTYVIEATLPGLSKNDVQLELANDRHVRLSIQKDENADGAHVKQAFAQEIYVPPDGDLDAMQAKMKNGLLHVVIPRMAPTKPARRKIAIQ